MSKTTVHVYVPTTERRYAVSFGYVREEVDDRKSTCEYTFFEVRTMPDRERPDVNPKRVRYSSETWNAMKAVALAHGLELSAPSGENVLVYYTESETR